MKTDFNTDIKTGRVETFELKDKRNLHYREDNTKKINIFLPRSYTGMEPYGILYFFDSQNLFSNAGYYTEHADRYGGWKLDIVLNDLYERYGKKIIVVGIDNADEYRERELFPDPESFGKTSGIIEGEDFSQGYLEHLSDFIMQTLHVFVRENYNVDEENIGIGGSSMGGIASFYCAIRELGFYKYVLSYSPAFALYESEAFEAFFKQKRFSRSKGKLPRIHIYCGMGDELEEQLKPAAEEMKTLLQKHGYDENLIFETFSSDNPHNEESWRKILPKSFEVLFDLDRHD